MGDTTTTEAPVETGGQTIQGIPVDDQGQAVSQPETPVPAEAGATTEPSEQKPEAPSEPNEPVADENTVTDEQLQKFAKSKGLTLDSDNAKKAAEMAIRAERNMHKATGRASELEKTMATTSDEVAEEVAASTGQDPGMLKRLQRVEVKDAVRTFWGTPDESGNLPDRGLEPSMIELLKTKPYLAGDLDALYATAIVKSGNLDAVRSQGGREAIESLAHKQQAAVPRGNAVNPSGMGDSVITPQNVDAVVAQMSVEEYRKRLPEINAAMAG